MQERLAEKGEKLYHAFVDMEKAYAGLGRRKKTWEEVVKEDMRDLS